jgi:hypothetical protein
VDNDDWRDIKEGSHIYRSLETLHLMGVSQCYVLFMCLLRNMGKINTGPKRIFEIIEKFTFQYSIIAKFPTNKVEKIYSKYALKIERTLADENNSKNISGKIQHVFSELEKDLASIKPSKEEFILRFMELSYGRSEESRKIIKYALSKIDEYYSSGEYKIDFDNVNIEHILPQKPGKEWGLKKMEIKDYVHKLGNLTIVSKQLNSSIGNKNLSEKIEGLKKSEIIINKKLVECIQGVDFTWGESQITSRQKDLAELAYTLVWAF